MTRFVRNRIMVALAIGYLIYWPLALITPKQIFLEGLNGWVAALSIGIMAAFIPGAWLVLKKQPYRLRGAHLLILGVTMIQLAIAGLFIWGWLYRVLGTPEWMADHVFRGSLVHLLGIGGLLHMLAADMDDDDALPTRGWLRVGIVVAIGCGIIVAVMLTV